MGVTRSCRKYGKGKRSPNKVGEPKKKKKSCDKWTKHLRIILFLSSSLVFHFKGYPVPCCAPLALCYPNTRLGVCTHSSSLGFGTLHTSGTKQERKWSFPGRPALLSRFTWKEADSPVILSRNQGNTEKDD